ncbi:MAG: nucleotidyl transferase AbiEii/AbiGii toxin family protein [Atopobiaceae bacterium]|nr:nucleotidyl transferase AbiEii/AbiGii toxin family protein [Atopobiaceae bacterium]
MRTKNAMQLKARVNARAREAGIPAQMMMQNYLLERLLERISLSPWRERVVVKGGMLIASMIGVASRTTMDLDTTVTGFTLTHQSAEEAFREIASVEVNDDWEFEFVRTADIRESDDDPGIRVHLIARYAPMAVPVTVDVTAGDRITPGPAAYNYRLLFDDRTITLVAYPLETVLAEKLETVVSRGVTNTRPRDFYDIHVLWRTKGKECDIQTLRNALEATCEKRRSAERIRRWERVLTDVASDDTMLALWTKYERTNPYVAGITLPETCETAKEVMRCIDLQSDAS